MENQHHKKALVKREWIMAQSEADCPLRCQRREVGRALVAGKKPLAEELLQEWMGAFPDRFYLELHRTNRAGDEECVHGSVGLAAKFNCPVVATNDVMFLTRDDFEAHESRVCIGESVVLDDPRREHCYSEEQYLKSEAEMVELFSDIPEALANTVAIAQRCSINVKLGEYFLPEYPVPEGKTMDQFFREFSHDGLTERLECLFDTSAPDFPETEKLYRDRLDFELNTIIQMGFPGIF